MRAPARGWPGRGSVLRSLGRDRGEADLGPLPQRLEAVAALLPSTRQHTAQRGEIPGVGFQIVSCDLAHTVPDTGRVRFSRSFVGEPGSPASLRHLAPGLGGPSGSDAEACLARIISFWQEPPSGPVWPDTTSECAKQQHRAPLRTGHRLAHQPPSPRQGPDGSLGVSSGPAGSCPEAPRSRLTSQHGCSSLIGKVSLPPLPQLYVLHSD